MSKNKIQQKHWSVRTVNGNKNIHFLPIFEIDEAAVKRAMDSGAVNINDKEVECRYVELDVGDGKILRFNFLDLFGFIYHCANEELRQQLSLRYERQLNYIPYDVDFKLSGQERQDGKARRRIQLPVDEISMAYAKSLADKHLMKLASKGAPLMRKR